MKLDDLKKLADLAPKPEAPPRQTYKTPSTAKLNVEKYLTAHGVAWRKETGKNGQDIWKVKDCIINPDHGPYEAWVGQNTDGSLYYICFHGSCPNGAAGWTQVRANLSGEKKLTPWMDGLSVNSPQRRLPPPKTKNNIHDDATGLVCTKYIEVESPRVPPPNEVDPWRFYEPGVKKGTMTYVPVHLADYLGTYLEPLVSTNTDFWRYSDGVWSILPETQVVQIATHALKSRATPARIDLAIKTLRGLVNQEEADWPDQHKKNLPRYINTKNGMIDLEILFSGAGPHDSRLLIPHHHKYGSRVQLPAKFIPDADYDPWLKFLSEIFPDKAEAGKISLLQQAFGYSIYPSCRYERAVMMLGSGANGKGTVSEGLLSMVGEDNIAALSMMDLQERFRSHAIQNMLVNMSAENPERKALETENFKKAVSGEPLAAEKKYGDSYKFRPSCTFWFSFNSAPVIQDKSYGFTRRVILLEFTRRFTKKDADPSLKEEQIPLWRDAILLWSLTGLQNLVKAQGFYEDARIREEKDEFMAAMNPVRDYVSDQLKTDPEEWEYSQNVFRDYKKYCTRTGIRPLGQRRFNEQIKINYPMYYKTKDVDGRMVFHGFTIDPSEPDDIPEEGA